MNVLRTHLKIVYIRMIRRPIEADSEFQAAGPGLRTRYSGHPARVCTMAVRESR